MKKFNHLFLVVLATMLIACSSDYENYVSEEEIPEEPTEAIYFTEDELLVLMQMRNPDNRICIDEATEIALDALDFFDGEINTRSGQARTIAGVTALRGEPVTRLTTRSADGSDVKVQMPDTVAFVFNFADDAGFTIVAADTRITSPILAFVDDGNLDLNEEINHPGLEVFFANMEEYIEYSIIVAEQMRDSLMDGILAKLNPDSPTTRWNPGTTTVTTTIIRTPGPWGAWTGVRPLSTVEWGQEWPYNELVNRYHTCPGRRLLPFVTCRGEILTGCAATAIAMLMAYWGHPAQIGGHFFDWGVLNSFTGRARSQSHDNIRGSVLPQPSPGGAIGLTRSQSTFVDGVARLMERIGAGIGMNYGCRDHGGSSVFSGSIIHSQRIVNYLHGVGFTGGNRVDFNTQVVINSLNNGSPVLKEGMRSLIYGHIWIIDGHLRRSRPVTVTTITTWHGEPPVTEDPLPPRSTRLGGSYTTITTHTVTETAQYLHNNWGWNGVGNGFFVAGVFDTSQRVHHSSGTWQQSSTDYRNTNNYNRNNRIFPNIRPR